MTQHEFLTEMQDVLQRDEPLSMDMALADIEEWDSLAIMGTAAFMSHNFSVTMSMDDFKQLRTIADIAAKAGVFA